MMEAALLLAGGFIGVDLLTTSGTVAKVTPVEKAQDIVNRRLIGAPLTEEKRQELMAALREGRR